MLSINIKLQDCVFLLNSMILKTKKDPIYKNDLIRFKNINQSIRYDTIILNGIAQFLDRFPTYTKKAMLNLIEFQRKLVKIFEKEIGLNDEELQ